MAFLFIALAAFLLFSTGSSDSHRCAACGTTKGLRQITAKTSSGEWYPDGYCEKHDAVARQYYYRK